MHELGYAVLKASDERQALQLLALEPNIALLLTDPGLPGGLDGRGLRGCARRRRPALGVLIMTAFATTSLVVEDEQLSAAGLQAALALLGVAPAGADAAGPAGAAGAPGVGR